MGGDRLVESVDPASAFAALSDSTRVDILRALWKQDDNEATFSELREAVGMADSGQFNYHLSKLKDSFVSKDEAGYRLTVAGRHVVGGLLAGAFTMEGSLDPIPLKEPCPWCGGDRTFRYEDERIKMVCEVCEAGMQFSAPPGLFAGYDSSEIPAVAERYLRMRIAEAKTGICPICAGRMECQVVPDIQEVTRWPDMPDPMKGTPVVTFDCERCGEDITADLATALIQHPAVVSFYYDNGIDVGETSLIRFVDPAGHNPTVRQDEPIRVAVTFVAGTEHLELLVDETLTVIDATRLPAETD